MLTDEGVDETAAKDINEPDLTNLQIKLGPRKKLIRILNTLKEVDLHNLTENSQNTFPSTTSLSQISNASTVESTVSVNQNTNTYSIVILNYTIFKINKNNIYLFIQGSKSGCSTK